MTKLIAQAIDLRRVRTSTRVGLAFLIVLSLLTVGGVARSSSLAAPASSGLACTTGVGTTPTFTLSAGAGYIKMPDGNIILNWSYSLANGAFQFPGPYLCVNQGDTVTIVLNNTLPEPTSILFPGFEGVTANGAPAGPEYTGTTLTSLTNTAPAKTPTAVGSVTYSFVAAKPGTYLYESGTDSGKQVQMGMYGAIVVRPTGTPACAYACAQSAFDPRTEYVMLFSEIDPALHHAVEFSQAYDISTLHPRYWLINGRAFPDTIAPNGAAYLPAQPYSSLVHITVTDDLVNPTQAPALVRYVNAGSRNHPFHPHGQNGRVVGRDAGPLVNATGQDVSYETFSTTIGSGQTWDELYAFYDQEHFNPTTNKVPVTTPQLQNQLFKGGATYYSGTPYLGNQGKIPVGTTSYNECGEFYMVWHSHALNEAANYDTGFGGMLTLQRIDPLPGRQAVGTTCSQ
jgi:FtsP/CotA-like multicopper oxidase with cupredoxin domain